MGFREKSPLIDMSNHPLPYNGTYFESPQKKFKEVILLVPFFNAHRAAMIRHTNWINRIGFDCVTFNLIDDFNSWKNNWLSSKMKVGLKHIWADQVESLLNEIPGQKIVFSFSNPSSGAIEAIARRNASDVSGLICDSGPAHQLIQSYWNYTLHEMQKTSLFSRVYYTGLGALWIAPIYQKSLHSDLSKFPNQFPVLSIQGALDPLISPTMIDPVFEPHGHLQFKKLYLPMAAHLNGLKDFKELYEPNVSQFLIKHATLVDESR